MEFDLKLLQRLLNHGRVDETGYPTGMDAPVADVNTDHHQTNQMGDNPMKAPATELEETFDGNVTPEMIERLKEMLLIDGIGEDVIAMQDYGFDGDGLLTIGDKTFPEHDMLEMAHQMGCTCGDLGEAGDMIFAVLEAISGGLQEGMGFPALEKKLDEFRADDAPIEARFTHVIDSLGHVTIQDTKTGKEIYLQGGDALELISQLPDGASQGQIQHVLAQYQHVMEDGETSLKAGDRVSLKGGGKGTVKKVTHHQVCVYHDDDNKDPTQPKKYAMHPHDWVTKIGEEELGEYAPATGKSNVEAVKDGLTELLYDVSVTQQKLKTLMQGAKKTGNTHAYFAFEHFDEQIQKLGDDIDEYIQKYTK